MAIAVEEAPETAIQVRIAELIHAHPWTGVVSKEEAVAAALQYRVGLSDDDRQAYDEQIALNVHPYRARETVERLSSRQPSRAERRLSASVARAA